MPIQTVWVAGEELTSLDADILHYNQTDVEPDAPAEPHNQPGEWERYGVQPNVGSGTDQSSMLQAAIDSGQPVVDLTRNAGDIYYGDTLRFTRGIRFDGSGSQDGLDGGFGDPGIATTRLLYTGASYGMELVGETPSNGRSNFHLSNFSLWGTAAALGGIVIGTEGYITQSSLKNVHVRNCSQAGAYGIRFQQCLKTVLENVLSHNNYDGFLWRGVNTTIGLVNCYAYQNTRYGYNIEDLANGSFSAGTYAESNGNAGLYINCSATGIGIGTLDFWGYGSEANCGTGGTAPIIITGADDAHPSRYIRFYGGSFQDAVGNLAVDMDRAERMTFYDPTLPSYAAGFLKVTSKTSMCHFHSHNTDARNANVTGNAPGRMTVHSGETPGHFIATLANGAEVQIPFTGGVVTITNLTSNKSALIAMNGSANTATVLADPDAGFANASTGGRIGIYYSSGYRVNNNVGSSQDIEIDVLNQR